MSDSSKLHDEKYKALRAAGLSGWGGNERVSNLSQMIEDRFFAFADAPSSGKLLELGCGAGNLSIALSNRGFDVFGVDFSESAIEWAKDNAKQASKIFDFRVADVTDLSCFSDDSFDVLYDGNCLHCLIGDRRAVALSEWKRVLKKDGMLFISSLCAPLENPEFPMDFDSVSRVLFESGIPYRFIPTKETIESELRLAGFKIVNKFVREDSPFGHINIHALKAYNITREESKMVQPV